MRCDCRRRAVQHDLTVASVSSQSVTIACADGSFRPFLRNYVQAEAE